MSIINKTGVIGLYIFGMLMTSLFAAQVVKDHEIGFFAALVIVFVCGTGMYFMLKMAFDREE